MERVVGHICRNALPPGYADDAEPRAAIGAALVDVLADLHTVDPAAVGLEGFGRPAGFVERQLRRWSQQWEASKTGELPALDRLRDELGRTLPPQRASAIVHGDYRLDNTILHPTSPGRIVAVLDWEMSTLGDPLTDLGTLLAYWSEDADGDVLAAARVMAPVTAAEGFPTRVGGRPPLCGADRLRRLRRRVVPGVRLLQARRRLPGHRGAGRGRRDARLRLRRGAAARRRRSSPPACTGWRAAERQRSRRQIASGRLRSLIGGGRLRGHRTGHPAVDAQDVARHEAAAAAEQEQHRLVELAGSGRRARAACARAGSAGRPRGRRRARPSSPTRRSRVRRR